MSEHPKSPSPPEPEENAKDSHYDSCFKTCGKCKLLQIHLPTYDEDHISCSCFDRAMCCISGFENYAKKVLANYYNPDEGENFKNLFPKMTIQTRLHNLGSLRFDMWENPNFEYKCSEILIKLLTEKQKHKVYYTDLSDSDETE